MLTRERFIDEATEFASTRNITAIKRARRGANYVFDEVLFGIQHPPARKPRRRRQWWNHRGTPDPTRRDHHYRRRCWRLF